MRFIFIASIFLLLNACATLKPPIHKQFGSIDAYQFIKLPVTRTVSSMAASNGVAIGKEINPSAIIEGILLKKGITTIDAITAEIRNQSAILKYGESGRRDVAGGLGGYTLEVTIKIISASSLKPIYLCTAEGQGITEADDIREAITRCLAGL